MPPLPTAAPRLAVLSLAALVLAACDEPAEDEPAEGAAPDDDVIVEEDELDGDPAPEDLPGPELDALWDLGAPDEAAVVAEDGASAEDLAADLADRDDGDDAQPLSAEETSAQGMLGALLGPGVDAEAVVVTAVDREAALALEDLADRDDVTLALAPTCDRLAGTARWSGPDDAGALLDEADCEQPAVVNAEPEAADPWVAVAEVADDEACLGTASDMTSMSACEDAGAPSTSPSALAGGLIAGFAPEGTATVEVAEGEDVASIEPVDVEGTDARAFALRAPGAEEVDPEDAADDPEEADPDEPGEDAAMGSPEAPDLGALEWRYLDDDGEVLEEG